MVAHTYSSSTWGAKEEDQVLNVILGCTASLRLDWVGYMRLHIKKRRRAEKSGELDYTVFAKHTIEMRYSISEDSKRWPNTDHRERRLFMWCTFNFLTLWKPQRKKNILELVSLPIIARTLTKNCQVVELVFLFPTLHIGDPLPHEWS